METSQTITKIAPALLAAQKEMGNAIKDSTNPYFKSHYADLNSVREACIPALNKNGITVLQPTVYMDGKPFVQTLLLHESGEYISSFTEIVFSKQGDAQAHGSGVTYARRYGLQSICNIGSEDDDGNAASGKTDTPTRQDTPKQELPWLNLWTSAKKTDLTKEGMATLKKLAGGDVTIETVKKHYRLSKEVEQYLIQNGVNSNPFPNE